MAKVLTEQEKTDRAALRMQRRRRNVLLVMGEIVLLLLLSITCYGMTLLNSYAYEELDPTIYKETSAMEVSKDTSKVTVAPDPEGSTEVHTNESGEVILPAETDLPQETVNGSGYRNILVLGTDARSQYVMDSGNGINTDVMIIVSINNATGDIKLVSIYRDTIMRLEDGSGALRYNKANNQYAVSGISDTVSMVNRNLGLDIDEYIIVNWYGVAMVVNQLGGIEMTIPNETILFWFNNYLDFTNRATGLWAPELPAPGTYTMSGSQVVAFCRIRYGGYNDTGRTEHQREAIQKILERAKQLLYEGQISILLDVAQTALGNVRTNLKLSEILLTVMKLSEFRVAGTCGFPQSYTTAQYVGNYPRKYGVEYALVANNFEEEVRQLHAFLFDDPNYQCSDFVKNVSYEMYMDRTGQ